MITWEHVLRLGRARLGAILTVTLLVTPSLAPADLVAPSERVVSRVTIREHATSKSRDIGSFRPGQQTRYYGAVGRWYKIRLADGRDGFVSKSWTRHVPFGGGAVGATAAEASPDELRIHFLNIGAGTCTVVECPGANAAPMIVDCGSKPGSRTTADLEAVEARTIVQGILANHTAKPNVVLSHGDEDHYSYIPTVLADTEVNSIWQGDDSGEYGLAEFPEWLAKRVAEGTVLNQDLEQHFHNEQYALGDDLPCGDANVYILTANTGASKNSKSLMLSIEYGDFAAIFSGDAEGVTEAQAIANFDGAVKATILSGSHHGADTKKSNSLAWAVATAPAVAIYSSGIVETYGHPRCESARRYQDALATSDSHPMHCCEGASYANRTSYETTKAEYSTETSGKIVVTTTGTSPLSLKCETGAGCDAEISY